MNTIVIYYSLVPLGSAVAAIRVHLQSNTKNSDGSIGSIMSDSNLRQRTSHNIRSADVMSSINEAPIATGLSAQSLLNSSPSHTGHVCKIHVPFIWSFLPLMIQKIIFWMSQKFVFRWFVSGMCPSMKDRTLCLAGSYLYR